MIVAASAIRWSLFQGGPSVARGPRSTSSARSPRTSTAWLLHIRGVIEVDGPAARACELGQHLAVHDGVGAALVGRTALEGDVRGEVGRPGTQRHRHDRFGQLRRRAGPAKPTPPEPPTPRTFATSAAMAASSSSLPSLVVDRRGRHAGFDQLDPPAVHDPVVGRCRDRHCPAEVMSYAQPHSEAGLRVACRAGSALQAEAGEGNRTLTKSLEGSCATTTPRPRGAPMISPSSPA